MKLIVGLGNPGEEYARTKHNVGFWAIDALQQEHRIAWKPILAVGYVGRGTIAGMEVILAKPLTFMNRSGLAVQRIVEAHQAEPHDVILLHDDIDLPPGKIRIKWRGGDAGHKGVRSVIEHLGTEEFLRIRIGVGRPSPGEDVSAYVLSPFAEEEDTLVEQVIRTVVMERISAILQGEIHDPRCQENTAGC